jgi:hypothetical protein
VKEGNRSLIATDHCLSYLNKLIKELISEKLRIKISLISSSLMKLYQNNILLRQSRSCLRLKSNKTSNGNELAKLILSQFYQHLQSKKLLNYYQTWRCSLATNTSINKYRHRKVALHMMELCQKLTLSIGSNQLM